MPASTPSQVSGPDADPRLVEAIAALRGYEIRFDAFKGHICVAVLAWAVD